MMAITILITAFLGLWHILWESIIAPTWRVSLRNRLFALRDEVRAMGIQRDGILDADAFDYLQEAINTVLSCAHVINFSILIQAKKELDDDPKLRRQIEARMALIDGCREAKDVHKKLKMIFFEALLANIGGWFVYLIPVVLLAIFLRAVFSILDSLIFVPVREIANRWPSMVNPPATARFLQ